MLTMRGRRRGRGTRGRARSPAACPGRRAASPRARARRRGRGGWSARRAAAGRSAPSAPARAPGAAASRRRTRRPAARSRRRRSRARRAGAPRGCAPRSRRAPRARACSAPSPAPSSRRLGGGELGLDRAQLAVAVEHELDRRPRVRRRRPAATLREHVAGLDARRRRASAPSSPRSSCEQARLAGAVRADDADLLAGESVNVGPRTARAGRAAA